MKTIAIALTLAAISSLSFAGVFTGGAKIGNCSFNAVNQPQLTISK